MDGVSDRIVIEEASVALVREYLTRKGCKNSLQSLEEELPRSSKSICNRAQLAQCLHIAPVMRKNKSLANPFRTIIETLIWDLLKQHYKIVRELQSPSRNTGRPSTARSDLRSSLIRNDKATDKTGDLEINDVNFDSDEIITKPSKFREKVTFLDDEKTVSETRKESSRSQKTVNHAAASYPPTEKSTRPQSSRGSRNFNATVMPSDLRPMNLPTKSKLTKRQASSVMEMLSASPEKVILSKEKTPEGVTETGNKLHLNEKKATASEHQEPGTHMKHITNSEKLSMKSVEDLEDVEEAEEDLIKSKCSSWIRKGSKTSSLTEHLVGKDTFYDVKTSRVNLTPTTIQPQKPKTISPKNRTEIPKQLKSVSINLKQSQGKPVDYETAIKLRELLFGSSSVRGFTEEWTNQSFSFHSDYSRPRSLRFGIVQKKGGSCGVLASVQTQMLKHLLFGKVGNNGLEVRKANVLQLEASDSLRTSCLCEAIVEILWRAGEEKHAVVVLLSNRKSFDPVGNYRADDITEYLTTVSLGELLKSSQSNQKKIDCNNLETLNSTVYENQIQFERGRGACILLLYSAILSRGINKVKADMDDPNAYLMGAHSYCTQEMVNLLTVGYAASNVFNDVMELDGGTVLKGITTRGDVGLLSLFEHYKSCKVGSNLKTPKFPIWIVCSESHFSVLFCLNRDLISDWTAERIFHLYYYDGLANQDEEIRLTVDTISHDPPPAPGDLTPPLELCILTKWPDANIDWNGTDPIL